MIIRNEIVLIFDLDDTLYKERDFLKSAFHEIAKKLSKKCNIPHQLIYSEMLIFYYNSENVFDKILKVFKIDDYSLLNLIDIYRNHKPKIFLDKGVKELLAKLKHEVFKTGLITDGRSIQQHNKLNALGLSSFFDDVIISEEFGSQKPCIDNFRYFQHTYGDTFNYIYIGDNTDKDFVTPNQLGWITVCILDDGQNIHKQSFDLETNKMPKFKIKNLFELELILNKISI